MLLASANDIEVALNRLTDVGVNGVSVSEHDDPVLAPNGKVYRVTFTGQSVRGNVEQLQLVTGECGNDLASTTEITIATVQEGGSSAKQFSLTR